VLEILTEGEGGALKQNQLFPTPVAERSNKEAWGIEVGIVAKKERGGHLTRTRKRHAKKNQTNITIIAQRGVQGGVGAQIERRKGEEGWGERDQRRKKDVLTE